MTERGRTSRRDALAGVATAAAAADACAPGSSPAVMATYARQDLVFSRGEGVWLETAAGERYLDLVSGVAVNALGHAHPRLVTALTAQAEKLWHTSNLYRVDGQERVAERLVEITFADRVFFCNSGAEACEGAIKTARRFHFVNGRPERWRIVTFEGAFHGRTIATLAAGGNAKYLEGFGPEAPGFDHVPFGDHEALERVIGPETAAIMIEPVQGEGGVRTVPDQCLRGLRDVCDENGLLLIFDEVQSGMGRSGRLFAHEWAGITPDIMAIAKGIGGGFPVGAFLATEEAAKGMTVGTHGSTFGGNPLAMAVADTVLDVVSDRTFLVNVQNKALRFKQALEEVRDRFPDKIVEVRGRGLLMGFRLASSLTPAEVVKAAVAQKLLLVGAGDNVVRLLPPLNIADDEIAEAVARLAQALTHLSASASGK